MFKRKNSMLCPAVPWKTGINVFNLERQEFPEVFRPNGAFYITKRDQLKRTGNLVNPESCGFYEMSDESSIDIDGRIDLLVAETLLKKRKKYND